MRLNKRIRGGRWPKSWPITEWTLQSSSSRTATSCHGAWIHLCALSGRDKEGKFSAEGSAGERDRGHRGSNHMLNDQPRLFFVHFWGNDETSKLLPGLHKALSDVSTAKK